MKKRINIYIQPSYYEAIRKIAEKQDRSISYTIDQILGLYIVSQSTTKTPKK